MSELLFLVPVLTGITYYIFKYRNLDLADTILISRFEKRIVPIIVSSSMSLIIVVSIIVGVSYFYPESIYNQYSGSIGIASTASSIIFIFYFIVIPGQRIMGELPDVSKEYYLKLKEKYSKLLEGDVFHEMRQVLGDYKKSVKSLTQLTDSMGNELKKSKKQKFFSIIKPLFKNIGIILYLIVVVYIIS